MPIIINFMSPIMGESATKVEIKTRFPHMEELIEF